MNSYIVKSILAVAVVAMAASCKPEFDTVEPSKGSADFTRYIALGNSLTSGFADGGLYLEGQQNSFPGMIAEQMKAVGGGSFATPYFSAAQANGTGYAKLTGFTATGSPIITKETGNLAVTGQTTVPGVGAVTLYAKYTGDINNYGVPGVKLVHARYPGYAAVNGLYERLLTGAYGTNNTTYLDFATSKPWTFFSLWLGNNDILGYASAGGDGAANAPTPKSTFTTEYNAVVAKLVSTGAKGVVATIPDVLSTPYFTTVTLATLKAAVPAAPAFYIKTGAGVTRAATATDLFTLTLSSDGVIGTGTAPNLYGISPANPIESKYVLDPEEVAVVKDYVTAYNNTIRTVANANGLALVDAYTILNEYSAGKKVNGVAVSAAYIRGNLFSLDGIHLTPMGYAIVANEFISAINTKYGSSISTVDVSKYRGVKYP